MPTGITGQSAEHACPSQSQQALDQALWMLFQMLAWRCRPQTVQQPALSPLLVWTRHWMSLLLMLAKAVPSLLLLPPPVHFALIKSCLTR
jgi:hypothetical protein